jgi:hypothetical protein
MRRLKKKFKIVESDLRKERDDGQLYHVGSRKFKIVIDTNHRSERERLDTVVHECLHIGDLRAPERKVRHMAAIITEALWRQGYRR